MLISQSDSQLKFHLRKIKKNLLQFIRSVLKALLSLILLNQYCQGTLKILGEGWFLVDNIFHTKIGFLLPSYSVI